MRCGECGSKELELKNAIGRDFPYKQWEKVVITVDINLTTCTKCGNVLLKAGDAKRLDEAIEDSLTRALG